MREASWPATHRCCAARARACLIEKVTALGLVLIVSKPL
jgi:hypothetical protein